MSHAPSLDAFKRVDGARLDALTAEARERPRGRLNLNLHGGYDDPVQRLAIAIEPGSYVRPHRHDPGRFELFIGLRGRLALLTFDAEGTVLARDEVVPGGAGQAVAALEVPGGAWHTVIALEPGSAFLEVKQGPYAPLSDKNFAAWAPREDDPAATRFAAWFGEATPGARPPALTEPCA